MAVAVAVYCCSFVCHLLFMPFHLNLVELMMMLLMVVVVVVVVVAA